MKLVKISDIFDLKYGVNLDFNKMDISTPSHGIPFVSRTSKNNGVQGYVSVIKDIIPNAKHTLSVAGGGSVVETFYQPKPYYSGRDLYILSPYQDLNIKEMLAYATIIRLNKYRYSFGRQANKTLRDILVPSIDDVKKRTKNISIPKKPSKKPFITSSFSLKNKNWQYFKITDLFNVTGTKSFTKQQIKQYNKGKYPYVVTSAENNGVENFYNTYTEKGGVLTIDSATIGSCFYQPYNFSASDHVEKLIPKFHINTYIAIFLQTVINQEKIRYNYGRKFAQMRIKTTQIKLPVTPQGTPDWQFMEEYVKSLPYSSNL